jgi:E-phenylitaconyl-CoA hydratase
MTIDLVVHGGVATITMNRPERHNALDLAMLTALDTAWRRVEDDDDVRVAILTGAGDRAFCSGADVRNFAPPGTPVAETYPAFFPQLTKPVIAAVNGLALGGGTELLGVTDLRVAAEHATFALTEPRLGLYPAGGSVVRYPRQLPWPLAMELLLTGRTIDAGEALRWGLVNRVVPAGQLRDAAMAYADMVLACAPDSVRAIKACALATAGLPLEDAFAASLRFQRQALASPDAAEGVAAFAEGRAPRWRNP